jgi:hypothetical protein
VFRVIVHDAHLTHQIYIILIFNQINNPGSKRLKVSLYIFFIEQVIITGTPAHFGVGKHKNIMYFYMTILFTIKTNTMKKLLLGMMLIALSVGAKAQRVYNNSFCEIKVSQTCYNPPPSCAPTTNWTINIPAGASVVMPAQCTSPRQTSYTVCWITPACNPLPCTTVNGTIPLGSCIPQPYSNPLGTCDLCSNNNGVGTVTYDPATRNLTVNP